MTEQLTKQEQIFIDSYIKQHGNSADKSSFQYLIGFAILSLSGLFMICYSGFLTLNNMTDKVIKWVFFPGIMSGLFLIISGYFIWVYYKKNFDKQKLAKILRKLMQ